MTSNDEAWLIVLGNPSSIIPENCESLLFCKLWIDEFTNSIINNKKLTVFNQGDHFRDFTYIDDVTSIIERIIFNLKRMKSNQYILNIGSGRSVPLMKLIKILENEIGKKAVLKFVEMQKGDVHKTYANINAISKIVNFKPQIDIKKGVKLYLKWYKKYYK